MSLRPCKECGHQISSTAKMCPNCGKKTGYFNLGCAILIIFIVISWMIGYVISYVSR